MNDPAPLAVVLSAARGGVTNTAFFADNEADAARYPTIVYPGWRHYVADDFDIPRMLDALADAVEAHVPHGPIRIVGVSLGGHLGYALALVLQQRGRSIGGFCAMDSFMIASAGLQEGWRGRALTRARSLVREGRLHDFGQYLRELFWRTLLRLGGERVRLQLRDRAEAGRLPALLRVDPTFEHELSMRLLIRHSAPWLASLDVEQQALHAPAVLIRTPLTADDDDAWRKRCPELRIIDVPGDHHTLFDEQNLDILRAAFRDATRDWS